MTELIPAATVIPLRDGHDGLEVLMLRRNSAIVFGGMWVFPGGRIDPEDGDMTAPGNEETVARHAAAREAMEEADLLVEPAELVLFSHWTPPDVPLSSNKRFSTWFFACRAPVGEAGEVTIDGGEIHEDVWVHPAEMLRRREEGTIQLVPPTVVTLHDLAAHATVDDVLAAAGARRAYRYTTRIHTLDDVMVAVWGGDAGYESGDLRAPGPRHRLVMDDAAWRFECDVDVTSGPVAGDHH